METLIRLRNVSKSFGKRIAVKNVNLSVYRGEIFGLLGHNGSGKSTIIGMILGQVWQDSGEIHVFGYNIASERQNALKKVGAIFETPAFYDYLTGWQNLQILTHYSEPTSPERIKQVIEWVGLSGREHTKVKTYSHGMRARLAIAQALLPNPELLILDEPGEGLDPEGIAEMRQTILRLHKDLNMTIFFSSHLLNEVEQLCSRIVVLKNGSLIFEGNISDIKARSRWYHLQTNDQSKAIEIMKRYNLIVEYHDSMILPQPDVHPPNIVNILISNGLEIHEFYRSEETLESFYLSLMNRDKDSFCQSSKGITNM